MDKKLILAVAGSGKTYYICNSIDKEKRNLILAFTNRNIKNIRDEIWKRFGAIPENTIILTFDSFVYGHCILPNHRVICKIYGKIPFRCEGVMFQPPPKPRLGRVYNREYINDSNLRHYIPRDRYYCAHLTKLICKNKAVLLPCISNSINKFYDAIYIDEFQDYRNEDFDFLAEIIKLFNNKIVLVGDYYQHSVSGVNNSGKPFGTAKRPVDYDNYLRFIRKIGLSIDQDELNKTRRCSEPLCSFVKEKININIESYDKHAGDVIIISDEESAIKVLDNVDIHKLVLRESDKYYFNSINWSYSKGDTYNSTCVILTEETSKIISQNFNCNELATITKNKLYVALTRSRGIVYLLPKNIFDNVKKYYLH